MTLELSSSAFESGDVVPDQYTCEGENISPPLAWLGVPDAAQSLVLICDDPDVPNGPWSHWVLYDIPVSIGNLAQDLASDPELSQKVTHGRNDFGNTKYEGPCPPRGETHTYYFRLYAVNEKLDLPAGATRQQVLDRIENRIVGRSDILARYTRS